MVMPVMGTVAAAARYCDVFRVDTRMAMPWRGSIYWWGEGAQERLLWSAPEIEITCSSIFLGNECSSKLAFVGHPKPNVQTVFYFPSSGSRC